MEREEDDEIVCLDESFFVNDNYQLTTFTFGSQVLELYCLQSASTDYDLTGQLVWPGAFLLNSYLSKNSDMLQGCSVIELGSGVGVTGILCSQFCNGVVLTDHNDVVLKILNKNIELQKSLETAKSCAGLVAEKLEWGNPDHMSEISQKYSGGFDLILGADIYVLQSESYHSFPRTLRLTKIPVDQYASQSFDQEAVDMLYFFQHLSVPPLFDTVEQLLHLKGSKQCKFILAYVSRAKLMDSTVTNEAIHHGMRIMEVPGTRSVVGNLEGVIFEITLQ